MKRFLIITIFFCYSFLGFSQLYTLAELDTIKEYKSLNEAIKNPEKVIRLNLKGKKLKELPPEIFLLTNLQELNVKRTRIHMIPSEISTFKNLQILDASNNDITQLPVEIGLLTNLKILRLSQNELEFLPTEIGQLLQLRYLDLWSNNLSGFPDEISKLTELKTVDLRVIQFSKAEQRHIMDQLPNVNLLFSQSCNCD